MKHARRIAARMRSVAEHVTVPWLLSRRLFLFTPHEGRDMFHGRAILKNRRAILKKS
jgi:hypothetical protein